MSDHNGELSKLFARLDAEGHGMEEHPPSERLSAFEAHELPPAEHAAIQEHLETCTFCRERLDDLGRFLAGPGEDLPAPGVVDFETAAGWRRLREQVVAAEPKKKGRNLTTPLAAALVLGALGLPLLLASAWIVQLRREVAGLKDQVADLRQPLINVPEKDLVNTRGEVQEIQADSRVRLSFVSSAPANYAEYSVEILNSAGRMIWSGTVKRSDDGALSLTIMPGFLSPGTYQLHLVGRGAGGVEPLEDYTLRVLPR
jgi:putative zinc finger protein